MNVPELQPFVVADVRTTGKILGEGSYGSVEEAEIPGAACVIKKLHDALLPHPDEADGASTMTAAFVSECRIMTTLRHPHVVQFLGICFLPGSRLPALIMEKLVTDHHNFLEQNANIPLSIKHSILLNVSQGLTYLHGRDPPIIHRDLTARNVLLTSDLLAKIGDLGNSRFINPHQMMTMTRNPGNVCYMAPETQEEAARYDTAIDIFSFGHLVLFTLTQAFPTVKAPTYLHSTTHRPMARTEIERRCESMDLIHQSIGNQHPLVQLAESCLEDYPQNRPSIDIVAQQLRDVQLVPYRTWDMSKLVLVNQVMEKERQIEVYCEEALHHVQQVESDENQMRMLAQDNRELQEQVETLEEQIETLEGQVDFVQTQNQTLLVQIMAQQRQIETQQCQNEVQMGHMSSQQQQIESLNGEMQAKQGEIEQLQQQLQVENQAETDRGINVVSDQQERVRYLQQQSETHVKMIINQQDELCSLKRRYESQLRLQRLRIQALQTSIDARQDQLHAQGLEIRSMQELINNLEAHQRDLRKDITEAAPSQSERMKDLQDRLQQVQLDQELKKPLSIEWQTCKDLAVGVVGAHTVVCDGKVYLAYGGHILQYVSETDEWVKLPCPSMLDFSMAVVNNKELILVGGVEVFGEIQSNNIIVWDEKSRVWVQRYPPVPSCSVIGYQHYIIVAGGFNGKSISNVEILDTLTAQWYTADQLPMRCHGMTVILVSDTAYFIGIRTDSYQSRTVISVSLPALILHATSPSMVTSDSENIVKTWDTITSIPVYQCAPFSAHNVLLIAGGKTVVGDKSSAICFFNLTTKTWEKVGELPAAHRGCACSVLPSGELLLVGGSPNFRSVFKGAIKWDADV